MSADRENDLLPKQQARLRELLSIPERERSDSHWDELVSIEIDMGPRPRSPNANSEAAPKGQPRRHWNKNQRAAPNPTAAAAGRG